MGHVSNKHLQSSTAASYLNMKKTCLNTWKKKSMFNARLTACQLHFTSLEAGAEQSCLCKVEHRPLLCPQQQGSHLCKLSPHLSKNITATEIKHKMI